MSSRSKRSPLYDINKNELQAALDSSQTWNDVLCKLKLPSESKITTLRAVIKFNGLSTELLKKNLKQLRRSQISFRSFSTTSYEELITKTTSRTTIKRFIITNSIIKYECSIEGCGNKGFHLDRKLSLQLDHIDGNNKNNAISNLRFLCPNCHSQTDTFCIRNSERIKNKVNRRSNRNKFIVEREVLAELVKSHSLLSIGKMYNVSDNAVRKRCIRDGINFKN